MKIKVQDIIADQIDELKARIKDLEIIIEEQRRYIESLEYKLLTERIQRKDMVSRGKALRPKKLKD